MTDKDFIQEVKFLQLNKLRCLRGDYYHNKCSICIDTCYLKAIDIVKGKIYIDDKCTNCGACIGECPSEAIHLDSFDENRYTIELETKDASTISCKSDSICLSVFDTQHLISMALRKDKQIVCDLSHCDMCDINVDNKIKDKINSNIDNANQFLAEVSNKQIAKQQVQNEIEAGRRGLFAKLLKTTQTLKEDKNLTKTISENVIYAKVPTKRQILKNSLKRLDNLDTIKLQNNYSFMTNKVIDFDSCNMCKECVEFCPTNALITNTAQNSILFQIGKCIECGICTQICKQKAIHSSSDCVDLVTYTFDRAVVLVEYTLEVCQDCKCSFAYRGGDKICDRCQKFSTPMYQDIFKIASEME